jgi:hypothetical protein
MPLWVGRRLSLTPLTSDDCGTARLRLPPDALTAIFAGNNGTGSVQAGAPVRVTVSSGGIAPAQPRPPKKTNKKKIQKQK